MKKSFFVLVFVLMNVAPVLAKTHEQVTVQTTVYAISIDGLGESIGTLTMHDSVRGLVIVPNLHGLPPGDHGFHLHEHADCSPGLKDGQMVAGLSAGGHFDPDHTMTHLGPYNEGHRGDLPVLQVNKNGYAQQPMLAPHVKLSDLTDHAFIIHEGGDNYADAPKPLGGGGNRIACAVVF